MSSAFFYAFNTEVALSAFGDPCISRKAFLAARDECRRFERLFSRTLEGSDVSRINAAGGREVRIAEDTYELLSASLVYCERSMGLFDITVGSVTRLWDFQAARVPSRSAIEEALSHVDWRLVKLGGSAGGRTACLEDPHAAIDLGGTAKGYIADRLTELLEQSGLNSFIINLGGNVVVRGSKPNGRSFRIGIRDPRDGSKAIASIEVIPRREALLPYPRPAHGHARRDRCRERDARRMLKRRLRWVLNHRMRARNRAWGGLCERPPRNRGRHLRRLRQPRPPRMNVEPKNPRNT